MQSTKNTRNGSSDATPQFTYAYSRRRSQEHFIRILQQVGSWFPIQSVSYSPRTATGQITLVRNVDAEGVDEIARLTVFVNPAAENLPQNAGGRPFIMIDAGNGPSLRFSSIEQLNEKFLGTREKFVSTMAARETQFANPILEEQCVTPKGESQRFR